jgi:hypothetical protein
MTEVERRRWKSGFWPQPCANPRFECGTRVALQPLRRRVLVLVQERLNVAEEFAGRRE